jgi:deazaflavin-dependent oxidoreductase (nitroreductase family)
MDGVVSKLDHWFKYTALPWYTSLGFSKRTITLEIAGRKTGKPTRVSLTVVRRGGSRYLVSLYTQSQWVKNVCAAQGRATILSGGKTPVRLVEIAQEERAAILLGYVQQRAFSHSGEESAKLFFGLGPKPGLADMKAIADRYVVFQIETLPN